MIGRGAIGIALIMWSSAKKEDISKNEKKEETSAKRIIDSKR